MGIQDDDDDDDDDNFMSMNQGNDIDDLLNHNQYSDDD